MKKTLNIDEGLLKEAREATGARTDTEAIRLGLEALVRQAAYQTLASYRGAFPDWQEAPRRRFASRPKRKRKAL